MTHETHMEQGLSEPGAKIINLGTAPFVVYDSCTAALAAAWVQNKANEVLAIQKAQEAK